MLDVCLLGCGGMMPLPYRHLTSCMLRAGGTGILIDCGEGTQVSLMQKGWSFKGIDAILLTHYHADHVSGLPGMLLGLGNFGRTEPVAVYGPRGLERIMHGLLSIAPELPFALELHEVDGELETVIPVGPFEIRSFKVDHGMPCVGYRIDLPRRPEFLPEKAKEQNIPLRLWSVLQRGESAEQDGILYTPDMVLGEERRGLRVCYCTDTVPVRRIVEAARESDLFICEGMYGEEERAARSNNYKHMTFAEAASLAREAEAGELWLTHFSPSLNHPKDFLQEAADIFPNTLVGKDRLSKTLLFEDMK